MIKLNNITKRFNKNVEVLDNISLDFDSKGMVFISGESGSGKTTLLNIISLLDKPTYGKYYIDDKDITLLSNNERDVLRSDLFGIIFQDLNLLDDLSIKDNLMLPLKLTSREYKSIDYKQALRSVNLKIDPEESPSILSGGERQRVAILRTILMNNRVIIADEPTGSLDESNAKSVMELLKELSKEKLVIIVSHQMELASLYADRIIELANKSVVADRIINESNLLNDKKDDSAQRNSDTKQKVPLSSLLLLAVTWLKQRKLRYIIQMLIMALSFSFIMLAVETTQHNDSAVYNNILAKDNVPTYKISRVDDSNLTTESVELITKELDEDDFVITYSTLEVLSNLNWSSSIETVFQYGYISEKQIEDFGFGFDGKIIESDSSANEIIITKYAALQLGLINLSDYFYYSVDTLLVRDVLLNFSLTTGPDNFYRQSYKIVGIIDTHYNMPSSLFSDKNSKSFLETKERAILNSELHSSVFFSKTKLNFLHEMINTYVSLDSVTVNSFYVSTKVSHEQLSKIIMDTNKILNYSPNEELTINTSVEYILSGVRDFKNVYSYISIFFAILLSIIAVLLCFLSIHTLFADKKKHLYVMRAIGFKKNNINNVFYMSNLVVSLLSTIISIIITVIALIVINTMSSNAFFTSYQFFSINFLVILGIFIVLSFLLCSLSYLHLKAIYSKENLILK